MKFVETVNSRHLELWKSTYLLHNPKPEILKYIFSPSKSLLMLSSSGKRDGRTNKESLFSSSFIPLTHQNTLEETIQIHGTNF